jgi:hypothetical protein
LWFIHATSIERIHGSIEHFHPSRRPDLWSGVGLACTYAGGCDEETIRQLKTTASDFWPEVAQGAAFAAKTRLEAGLVVPHTALACSILCNTSPEGAAQETDTALNHLASRSEVEPRYEVWRKNIQSAFADKRFADKREDANAIFQLDQASA